MEENADVYDEVGGIDFQREANLVIRETRDFVSDIVLSNLLPASREVAYLNVKTKDGACLCVQLDARGFQVVGNSFDEVDCSLVDKSKIYEMIGPLLEAYSPSYRQLFCEQLISRLNGVTQ